MDTNKKIKQLNIQNIIFIVSIILSISSIVANYYEKDELVSNEKNNIAHYIRVSILIVGIIIYLYFLYVAYRDNKEKYNFINKLNLFAAIIFLIGGSIQLYIEIIQNNEDEDELEIF